MNGASLLESHFSGIKPCSRSGFANCATTPLTTKTAIRIRTEIPTTRRHDVIGRRKARKLRLSRPIVNRKTTPNTSPYWIPPRMLELHWYATSFGGGPLLSCAAYATVDMNTTSAHQPARRHFMRIESGDPLPEGPPGDCDSEEEGAARRGFGWQVARLDAWLPKPLTRAHDGRIIRAWRRGTSRSRRRTRH